MFFSITAIVIALLLVILIKLKLLRERRNYAVYKALGFTSLGIMLQIVTAMLLLGILGSAAGADNFADTLHVWQIHRRRTFCLYRALGLYRRRCAIHSHSDMCSINAVRDTCAQDSSGVAFEGARIVNISPDTITGLIF